MPGDHDVAFAEHLLGALRQGDGVAVLPGLDAHALQGVVVGVAGVGHAPVVGAAIGDYVLALVVLVDRRVEAVGGTQQRRIDRDLAALRVDQGVAVGIGFEPVPAGVLQCLFGLRVVGGIGIVGHHRQLLVEVGLDRKSTRLNSS